MALDHQKNTILGVASAFLLLAVFDGWSYDFFVLLRFVVCISAARLAWLAYNEKRERWVWTYGIIAVLFNPFFPLHFGRDAWVVIDTVTALLLIVSGFLFKPLENKRV